MTSNIVFLLRIVFALALALATAHASAAAYTFPGTLPAGCVGSAGTYTCSSLTLGNNDTVTLGAPLPATINVNGNFNTGNRAFINAAGAASDLTINVNGSVATGNQGQINGSLTATGPINLGNSTSVASCVRSSSSQTINLSNNVTVGAVCCGALGACTSSCVVNNSGAPMPALCAAAPTPSTPSRFNAFETSTAAGSVNGVIKTKISGTSFSVAIVAINTAGTGVATTFTGNVRVEVLDASNNTGALNSSTNCRSTWSQASGTSSTTLNFAASDAGRKNVSITVSNIFPNARIRVSYPDTGTATAVGCSTDNFAIRPASFANLSATDGTASTTGTTRALSNTGSTGGVTHKAGRPFTVSATVTNGAGATITSYTGTPTVSRTSCGSVYPCGSNLGALTLALTNTSGVFSDTNARYAEAGAFDLQLVDSSFAAVDASDGSTSAELEIRSSTITVGRFVPDRFGWAVTVTPQLQAGCGSFTYYGQPFGYALVPQATLSPRAEDGTATGSLVANYPSSNYPVSAPGIVQIAASYAPTSLAIGGSATPTLSLIGSTNTVNVTGPSSAGPTPHTLAVARSTNTPQAEAAYGGTPINLTWTATDNSELTVTGNQSITGTQTFAPLAFASNASNFRYGHLKLGSAYGSELIALAVPLETQYWNATTSSFVINAADSCTVLPTNSVSLANFRGSLAACQTAPTSASVTVSSGRAVMRLSPSGNGNKGSVDGTVHLGATLAPAGAVRCAASPGATSAAVPANLPWLQSKAPGGTTFDQNPSARFSFGQYRSPLIQLREMY